MSEDVSLKDKLIRIQKELKAPKQQYNAFGKYKYRNQEDILEALKPLLHTYKVALMISDEIKEKGEYIYVESTVTASYGEESLIVKAQAGISDLKGMSLAQTFGSSSSYARKYALNGMFLIDDTRDADSTHPDNNNNAVKDNSSKPSFPKTVKDDNNNPWLNVGTKEYQEVISWLKAGACSITDLRKKYKISKVVSAKIESDIK